MNFPKGLMKDTSITLLSRCLHAIIVSLHHTKDGCYAGNEWFADELGVCANTISKHMGELDGVKFIERELRPRKYGGRDRYIIPLKYINIPKRKAEYSQKGIMNDTYRNPELDNKDIPNSNSSNRKNNNSSSDIRLTPDLIQLMKTEYPLKDIDKAVTSFYAKNKTLNAENIESRFRRWCSDKHESPKKFIEQFKSDTCGYPMGYCDKCGVSASYEENEIGGESKCCHGNILPIKPKRNSQVVNSEWV